MTDAQAGPCRSAGARFRLPTPMEFVCLLGGLFLTIQYSWLLDDAFIYFRYADNLIHLDRGLVFNAGEYVEGFSSPLWMLLLIALRLTGMDFWNIVRMLGLLSYALFWLLVIHLNRQLSPPKSKTVNLPLCYLTFTYGVATYFTSGLESPFVQLAAPLFALLILRPETRWLQVCVALTPLVRHELALPLVLCTGWIVLRKHFLPWLLIISSVCITGAWILFRIYYYADIFPNTFYLKDAVDIRQGLVYLQDTAGPYWLWLVLGVLILMSVYLFYAGPGRESPKAESSTPEPTRTKRNKAKRQQEVTKQQRSVVPPPSKTSSKPGHMFLEARLVMLIIALSVTAYVIKIGGDPRHYRYLAFPFCLVLCAFGGVAEGVMQRMAMTRSAVAAATVGLVVAGCSATFYPVQLQRHPIKGMDGLEKKSLEKFGKDKGNYHRMVNKITDAATHRHNPTLAQPAWGWSENMEMASYYQDFKKQFPDKDHLGVYDTSSWCSFMYRRFELRFVHTLGLTEPVLARVDVPADRPAHKERLIPMAGDIGKLLRQNKNRPERGLYQQMSEAGLADPWVGQNLETINIVEAKMLNEHRFGENLRLAFSFPPKIDPGDRIARWIQAHRRASQSRP